MKKTPALLNQWVETKAVAGSTLVKLDASLTHAVAVDKQGMLVVLCGRAKVDSMLDDDCATNKYAPPTCTRCRKLDPRFS